LESVTIAGVDVTFTSFDEAELVDLRASRAALQSCSFVGASLVDCDLRGADLSPGTPNLLGTSRGTRFARCDLRDTTWTGRDRDEATFTDCRF
jgi:uncharacterized protein YjbI with pentapeptide repeats